MIPIQDKLTKNSEFMGLEIGSLRKTSANCSCGVEGIGNVHRTSLADVLNQRQLCNRYEKVGRPECINKHR